MVCIILDLIFIILIMQCAFWDIKKRIIPNKKSLAIFLIALVKIVYIAVHYLFFNKTLSLDITEYFYSRLGGFFIALLLFGIPYMIKQSVGAGDLKIACSSGLFLGFSSALTAFFTAFLSCAAYAIFLQIYVKKNKKSNGQNSAVCSFLTYRFSIRVNKKFFLINHIVLVLKKNSPNFQNILHQ